MKKKRKNVFKFLHQDLYHFWATARPWRTPWAERLDTLLGSPGAAGLSVKLTDAGDFDCMHFTDRLASCHSRGVNHKRLQLPYSQPDRNTIAGSQWDGPGKYKYKLPDKHTAIRRGTLHGLQMWFWAKQSRPLEIRFTNALLLFQLKGFPCGVFIFVDINCTRVWEKNCHLVLFLPRCFFFFFQFYVSTKKIQKICIDSMRYRWLSRFINHISVAQLSPHTLHLTT